jgi:hypothetical protein
MSRQAFLSRGSLRAPHVGLRFGASVMISSIARWRRQQTRRLRLWRLTVEIAEIDPAVTERTNTSQASAKFDFNVVRWLRTQLLKTIGQRQQLATGHGIVAINEPVFDVLDLHPQQGQVIQPCALVG